MQNLSVSMTVSALVKKIMNHSLEELNSWVKEDHQCQNYVPIFLPTT